MKKIRLGTSDAWSMSRSSHRPSEQHIILKIVGFQQKKSPSNKKPVLKLSVPWPLLQCLTMLEQRFKASRMKRGKLLTSSKSCCPSPQIQISKEKCNYQFHKSFRYRILKYPLISYAMWKLFSVVLNCRINKNQATFCQ